MQCGGRMPKRAIMPYSNHSKYTAFHMHNDFPDFQTTRNKYLTYGHPDRGAMEKRLEDITNDLKLMVQCVLNQTDAPMSGDLPEGMDRQDHQRQVGGIAASLPPLPIYFRDEDYVRRKHASIRKLVMEDEAQRLERLNLTQPALLVETMKQEIKEAKRLMWDREAKIQALEKQHNLVNGK